MLFSRLQSKSASHTYFLNSTESSQSKSVPHKPIAHLFLQKSGFILFKKHRKRIFLSSVKKKKKSHPNPNKKKITHLYPLPTIQQFPATHSSTSHTHVYARSASLSSRGATKPPVSLQSRACVCSTVYRPRSHAHQSNRH